RQHCWCRVSGKALSFGGGTGTLRAMRYKRYSKPLVLSPDERPTLEQWARRPKTAQRLALRARMVLACSEGQTNRTVAAQLPLSANSVSKPGRPRKATDDQVIEVITPHARRAAGVVDPVDNAEHSWCRGTLESHHFSYLADVWVAVASPRHVQAVGGPPVRGESSRYRRTVS